MSGHREKTKIGSQEISVEGSLPTGKRDDLRNRDRQSRKVVSHKKKN